MRKSNLLIAATILVFLFCTALVSCGSREESTSESKLEEYSSEMKAKIDRMEEKLEDLGETIEAQEAEMKAALQSEWEDLKEKQSAAKAKLEDIKNKAGEAWEEMIPEMDEQMKNLEAAYEDLLNRLKG